MSETPIRSDTGVHPFDADEFIMMRATIGAWEATRGRREEERPNLAAYAAAVMPAMIEKIEQLRGLLAEASKGLTPELVDEVHRLEEDNARLTMDLRTMRRNVHHLAKQAREHHEDAERIYRDALAAAPLIATSRGPA